MLNLLLNLLKLNFLNGIFEMVKKYDEKKEILLTGLMKVEFLM
jgi:hypothetical protein